MDLAARRPAPIARITVAPPVTMSPPANTPFLVVRCVSELAWMYPRLSVPKPGVVLWTIGLALVPTAITATARGISNSDPATGTGRLRPDASGSPSSMRWQRTAASQPHQAEIRPGWSACETQSLPHAHASLPPPALASPLRCGGKAHRLCALPGAKLSEWHQAQCSRRRLRLHLFRAGRASARRKPGTYKLSSS